MSKLPLLKDENPWYDQGLRFECTGCGQCCTGSPGYVWVSEEEIEQIADHLGLTFHEFAQRFLRYVKGRFSLLEKPVTYDCIFLKENKCQIYSVRPTQCRTFPWWPQLLKTREEWEKAASFCEGIKCEAPLTALPIIEEQLHIQLDYLESLDK